MLICIRSPLARAVIADSLAGHAGCVDRIEAISTALAARSTQSGDRIGKTLAFNYISGFFWARLKYELLLVVGRKLLGVGMRLLGEVSTFTN